MITTAGPLQYRPPSAPFLRRKKAEHESRDVNEMQVGGSFGGTCGLLLMTWLPSWNIQPGLYAMCAATAMLGGVFRASISLVVLLVEGTLVAVR